MATFSKDTSLFNYFRKEAMDLGCNPCFDGKEDDLRYMNENGGEERPSCLCHIGIVDCPCPKWRRDSVTAEPRTKCYCEVFEKV